MNYSLGVDLGTTFVAAAITRDNGRVEMITLGDSAVASPAVVLMRPDGSLVFGDAAARRAVSNPTDVAWEVKRRLGDPTPVRLGGAARPATELLGAGLRDVLARIAATEGGPARRVVLTHPANWGPFRRGLFEDVAALAGLEDPPMLAEPEAAGVHYAATRDLTDGELLAVYDLGGGTFDASVLRKRADGVEILGTPEGIERLGGVDFDEAILAHVDHASGGALGELDLRDTTTTTALARLRQDCVLAKEALSVDDETTVPVFLPGRHLEVTITRGEFEDMVRAPVESTIGALRRTLRSASVRPDQLSAVLLVGGSSRIPIIARTVGAELGCRTVVDSHPKHAVALGAAIVASRRHDVVTADAGVGAGVGADATSGSVDGDAAGSPSAANTSGDAPGESAETTTIARRGSSVVVPSAEARPGASARADPPRAYGPTSSGPGWAPPARPASGSSPPANGRGAAAPTHPPNPMDAPTTATRATPGPEGPTRPTRTTLGPPADPRQRPEPGLGGGDPGRPPTGPVPAADRRPPSLASRPEPTTSSAFRTRVIVLAVMAVLVAAAVVAVALLATGVVGPGAAATGTGSSGEGAPSAVASAPVPTVVNRLAVGPTPGFVTLSPDGRVAYVANRAAKTITVVDTARAAVTATVPVAVGPPQYLTASPDGQRLYVSVFDQRRTIAAVAMLDTTTSQVVATVPVRTRPFVSAVTPDGTQLWVPNHDSGSITVIDTADAHVIAELPVAPNPHWVAFSADGTRAYTANHESNLISVIDTANRTVLARVAVGTSPHSVVVNPARPLVANANYDAASVSFTDTSTDAVVATVPVGRNPQALAWAPDGRHLYTVNVSDNSVSVIDADTFAVTATLPTGPSPSSVAVLPDGRQGFVTTLDDGSLTVLDLAG